MHYRMMTETVDLVRVTPPGLSCRSTHRATDFSFSKPLYPLSLSLFSLCVSYKTEEKQSGYDGRWCITN
jgi:hypothetical protein